MGHQTKMLNGPAAMAGLDFFFTQEGISVFFCSKYCEASALVKLLQHQLMAEHVIHLKRVC